MKKTLFFIALLIPILGYTQDLNHLSDGITFQISNLEAYNFGYTINNELSTNMFTYNQNEADSVFILPFTIGNSDYSMDKLFVIINVDNESTIKAFGVPTNKGLIRINKNYFDCGTYKIVLMIGSRYAVGKNFTINKKLDIQKQIGKYLIYWKDTKFEYKYVGIQ